VAATAQISHDGRGQGAYYSRSGVAVTVICALVCVSFARGGCRLGTHNVSGRTGRGVWAIGRPGWANGGAEASGPSRGLDFVGVVVGGWQQDERWAAAVKGGM
jgi:hypothetical protein